MSDIPTVVSRVYFNGAMVVGTIKILPDGTIEGEMSEVAHPMLVEMIRQGQIIDLSFTPVVAHPG